MGLFSKKPKATTPQPPAAPGTPRAEKPPKGKKISVDTAEFLALRNDLTDLRARLEASEQAKVMVENRLAALDATTTAMANERGGTGGDDIRTRVNELHVLLGTVAESAAAAQATADNATAKAIAAATVAGDAAAAPDQSAPVGDPELAARLDELAVQVQVAQAQAQAAQAEAAQAAQAQAEAQAQPPATDGHSDTQLAARLDDLAAKVEAANAPDPGLLARLDQLSSRLDGTPELARVAELETRLGELSAKAEQPVAAGGPDATTLARIDQLAERVAAVDAFGAQLSQLNARVTAQAEFGAQLGSLRDRIHELQNGTEDRRSAALAATGDADLRDRVNAIADRIGAGDNIGAQIAQLAERVAANDASARQATEQVATVEQRLNAVSTELANQVSELGRDIDGLAAQRDDLAQGAVSDELIDSLKTAQVKLAAEQARYEIAFRQDLATLAEQVRHTRKP